ncbi:hypothetical protein yrohd0001_25350 [Yersinia rohdei ATCC 43380]|nr:hypothetical protein yrohd0001_25350 [Yersinia rohdei ATCC 43380]
MMMLLVGMLVLLAGVLMLPVQTMATLMPIITMITLSPQAGELKSCPDEFK